VDSITKGSDGVADEFLFEDPPILAAQPAELPNRRRFVGRQRELQMCRVAWGVNREGTGLLDDAPPLSFRLEGPPGMGKNEIVYELARRLGMPLYVVQGHEEFTPEDLSLLLTPDTQSGYGDGTGLTLRASPLATAIRKGGLFFFDEINRVPERALSPLASVLDGRQSIYSAMTGIEIVPRDEDARARFRFCCALNPSLSDAGHVLPDYIEQRTLPAIEVLPPPVEELLSILEERLRPSPGMLADFERWYLDEEREDVSVRQAIALVTYAKNYGRHDDRTYAGGLLRELSSLVLGRRR
jgi:hypothetical protein